MISTTEPTPSLYPLAPNTMRVLVGGQTLTALPLTIGGFKLVAATMRRVAEGAIEDPVDLLDAMVSVIHVVLLRAHPDLAREDLEAHLGCVEAQELFAQLVQLGLPQVSPGERTVVSPSGFSIGI